MERLISILLLSLFIGINTIQAEGKNDILIINSANFKELWTKSFYECISSTLTQEGYTVEAEEMEIPNLTNANQANACRKSLLINHPQKPQMVIFIGDPAWVVCRELFDNEWKDIPVLVAYGREYIPQTVQALLSEEALNPENLIPATEYQKQYNFTSIEHPFYVDETIQVMLEMMPQMKHLIFIYDHRYISRCAAKEVSETVASNYPQLTLHPYRSPELPTEALLDSLASFDRTAGIIYYSWFITSKSTNDSLNYLDDNVQKIISSFSKTPVFLLSDRRDIINDLAGGFYEPVEQYSDEVMKKIRKILQGASASSIPIGRSNTAGLHLNYANLQSHGIDPSLYPSEATYINAPPSYFQKYKMQLTLALSITLLTVGFVAARLIYLSHKEKLREREIQLLSQYRQLINTMPIIYVHQQQLADNDFIILDVNSTFEKVVGCQADQVLNKRLSILLDTHPNLLFLKNDKQGIFTLKQEDGNVSYFDKVSFRVKKNQNVEIFCADRTQEHIAALELEKQYQILEQLNDKYRLILQASGIIPWIWDLEKNELSYDRTFGNFDNNSIPQHIVQQGPIDLYNQQIHPEDAQRMRIAFNKLLRGEIDSMNEEYRNRQDDQSDDYIWVRTSIIVGKKRPSGHPLILVGAVLNIEQQKKLENNLRQAKEQAEEMNRLKSAFFANMSHEIRTPLNAIVGFSEMLIAAETEEERSEYCKHVVANNDLLLQLINDVLDLSKIESGMLSLNDDVVDLFGLFCEQEQRVRTKNNNPNLNFIFDQPAEPCLTYVDSARLTQILSNLLSNAIKFTPSGQIHLGYQIVDNSNWIELYVKDSGCGIDPEQLNQIFERFVKLNNFIQGTGLGLPVCRSLIEKMGGTIWAESEIGKGSTFKFRIPYRPIAPTPSSHASA